jgi:O-methyltransferase involved in polyketide biosynthesis
VRRRDKPSAVEEDWARNVAAAGENAASKLVTIANPLIEFATEQAVQSFFS